MYSFLCWRQSIQSRGPNLKVRRSSFLFLLILALKKHAVRNAITSINNSLLKSKIILIGVTSSELLFPEHFFNYLEKNIAFFSKGI